MKTKSIRLGRMIGALLLPLFILTFIVLQAYGARPGQRLWVKRYNYWRANGDDTATAIALDSTGNVHVTGYSEGSGTGYDYATIKYDSAGNTLWVRRYNYRRADGNDYATAIALDGSGNVYVTGYSQGSGTGYDYATIKYAP